MAKKTGSTAGGLSEDAKEGLEAFMESFERRVPNVPKMRKRVQECAVRLHHKGTIDLTKDTYARIFGEVDKDIKASREKNEYSGGYSYLHTVRDESGSRGRGDDNY